MARRTATHANDPPPPAVTQFPYRFTPRSYQLPVLQAWEQGCKRIVMVWPRRHGKDLTALSIVQKSMIRRPGLYWHIYPTLVRGRSAMWDGQDFDGVPFRSRWPRHLMRSDPNETEMRIELQPFGTQEAGSSYQVMGADRLDQLAGPNPVGVIFSEFQLHDPAIWYKIVQPILAENGGWAIFDFTPEGKNHAHKLYLMACQESQWFAQKLTIRETRRDGPGEDGTLVILEDETPVVLDKAGKPRESVAKMRREGTPEEDIQSQYYTSFEGSLRGAVFGDMMAQARKDGRVGRCPWDPRKLVKTAWDIGRGDGTAIWFYQTDGRMIYVIDYYFERGQGVHHFCKIVREKRYLYNDHLGPHDIEITDWGALESRKSIARDLGVDFRVAPKPSIEEGIDALRRLGPRMVFDDHVVKSHNDGMADLAEGGGALIEALDAHHYAFDEKKKEFGKEPVHDWSSHAAAAGRYLALAPCEHNEGVDYRPPKRYASSRPEAFDHTLFARPAMGSRN